MAQTVIGIFDSASEAQEANQELLKQGFRSEDVDVSTQNTTGDRTMTDRDRDDDEGSGVGKFFRSLFSDDNDDDDRYRKYEMVADKGTVVTVHAQSSEEAERASEILDECGAVDVDERASQYSNTDYGTGTGMNADTMDNSDSVKVIEEDMHVGKRDVETGGKRLKSRIIERPVEENVRLRSERVTVNRNPVNRAATEADFDNFKEGTVEMTEHAERAVVSKEARVVEEISLNKEVDETEEKISDTVRRTDVEVEDIIDTDEDRIDTDEDRLRKSNQDSIDRNNRL